MNIKNGLICMLSVFLMACGGGGGNSPKNDEPSIDTGLIDETAVELAVAAQKTSAQILLSESDIGGYNLMLPAPTASALSNADGPENTATGLTIKRSVSLFSSKEQVQLFATETDSYSENGTCGGSVDCAFTLTMNDENVFPYTIDADFFFDDYCFDAEDGYWIIYDGIASLYISCTDENSVASDFEFDISYTSNLPPYTSGTLYYAGSCSIIDGVETCSVGVYESDTTTYSTSDVFVSENSSSAYDISYTMTDSEGNYYSVDFTGLTLCEDGNVGSGSGSIIYNGEEIDIEYTNCDEFVVTYKGNTAVYDQ